METGKRKSVSWATDPAIELASQGTTSEMTTVTGHLMYPISLITLNRLGPTMVRPGKVSLKITKTTTTIMVRFEQEDGWANYTIDEDQAYQETSYSEAYEEPQANEDVNANHAIMHRLAYHCH